MSNAFWDAVFNRRPRPPKPPVPPPQPPPPQPPEPPPSPTGGFIEHATSLDVRPSYMERLHQFVPERGAFMFPAPYDTLGIRVTNSHDAPIHPVGYSYWSNINNHAGAETLLVFVGAHSGHPLFFRVHKTTGDVEPLGSLVPYRGTGEGWYWSSQPGANLYLIDGPRLRRFNVETGQDEIVFEVSPQHYLWQAHSSDDDQSHSATLRDASNYVMLASVAWRRGNLAQFSPHGRLDECQIDQSGRYLVIKEDDDNRVIDLETNSAYTLNNELGAAGHSDCGWGTLVGEDDYHAEPGALREWSLGHPELEAPLHYHLTQWGTGLGHVSVRGKRTLISNANRLPAPRVNEIVSVTLDGSLNVTIHAPNLIDMNIGALSDYDKLPKANLDPTGEYACWTANLGTDRLHCLLVRL